MWLAIAFVLVAVIAYAVAPKQKSQNPAFEDADVPTASQGKPVNVIFGKVVMKSPNVVWYGDLKYKAIKK